MKLFSVFAGMTMLALTLTSCDKAETPAGSGALQIEIEHRFGNAPFALNSNYITENNDTLSFTMVKYYVTNVQLKNTDGETFFLPESYYLINLDEGIEAMLTIDSIPAGTYTEISFLVGVDSTRNVSGAQTGDLSQTNDMFWSWNSGYIFVRMEGTSQLAQSGSFVYHLGGFSGANSAIQKRTFDLSAEPLQISDAGTPLMHFITDLRAAFSGQNALDPASIPAIHMPGAAAKSAATKFAEGIILDHIHV